MANLCSFNMMVKGKKNNIKKFYNALTQSTKSAWMGRGAEAEINYREDYAYIDGWCKWSVQSSLIDNAKSMEKQRKTGEGSWYWQDEIKEVKRFITLFEACKKYNLNMEVFSYEPEIGFSEHYKYENGNVTADEECEYYEIDDDFFNPGERKTVGGFDCEFNLADVVY